MMMLGMMDWLAGARARVLDFAESFAVAPHQTARMAANVAAHLKGAEGVRAFAYILVLLIVGVGLEWLYWTYAAPALTAVATAAPKSIRERLRLALRRYGLRLFGLLLFGVSVIAASSSLTWPHGVQELLLVAVVGLTLVRLVFATAELLLSPSQTHLRLLAMTDAAARRRYRQAAIIATLAATGWLLPDLLEQLGGIKSTPNALRLLIAVMLALLCVGAARVRAAPPAPALRRRRLPAAPLGFFASLAIVATLVLWIAGAWQAAASLAVALAVLGVETVLRQLIADFSREEANLSDSAFATAIVLRFGRLLAVVAGLAIVAQVWSLPIFPMQIENSFAGRVATRAFGVIALLLVVDAIWLAARTAIDLKLKSLGPILSESERGPNGRLITLLPLLRMALGSVLATLTTLSALSIAGVEITPLLAGAGVIGIAVGFGAQTLVRDMIAGMFFLIEDVFRVGEYIESGNTIKGTVEKITLRSVALRHQDGPIFFVPYGALGAVRNNSRDFAVDKFNLPLPAEVDSEVVRKLIKKVGEQMMEDPEIGPMMVAPLKGRLYRIDPGIKVFRCKFQTQPGNQTMVRAKAYKGIEQALKGAGLTFADNATRVVMHAALAQALPERPLAPAATV